MAEKYCSKCGKKLAFDANFCPDCGAVTKRELVTEKPKSGLVIAAGILVIIAAYIGAIAGVIYLQGSLATLSSGGVPSPFLFFYQTLVVVGFIDLVGFVFGLAAGIQSMRRKHFGFAAVGISILLLAGVLNFYAVGAPYGSGIAVALQLGAPVVILSLLGLILVVIRKQEFA